MAEQITVGLGAGTEATDMVLNIGPQHPSTHGVLRLKLTIDAERVTSCEPIIGYMHRGAEKLYEARDFRQIMVLANRHDWLSAFSSELGVALAAERLMELEVPDRATWLRMAMAEMNRVLNHLMFLGSFPLEIGAITPMFYAFTERDHLQKVFEEATGGRIHYMYNQVGGLKKDVPAGWEDRARSAIDDVAHGMKRLDAMLRGNDIFAARTKGIGVLDPATAAAYGVSGPVARASGLNFDIRREEPYLFYDQLDFPVVTRETGDCYARFEVLLDQVYTSLDIARECLDRAVRLEGPVNSRLPKIVKVPEGHTYLWTENPLGANGYYLVSRGGQTPWRLKLRSASFSNVQALTTLMTGCLIPDMIAVLGSMFFVVGDVDK
ncbi:NADH-quinone oxidoreductase subunit D [Natronoglycomyces albus]|uniref:NADH-quinone oxidoreductase subunit D n=1 Tax=Natronoglycomyces albus TaxID=2811108 RepID=A0A895XSA1_9ACTN|nr:NADH-quinone oxidoreductase subunit D [Natronoglycomyces albus]QSB05140.1 NADH-quinone oxidoreductase subunit D [Natronoglycomyces albus]